MGLNVPKEAFQDMKTYHKSEILKLRTEITKTTKRELAELREKKNEDG